MSGKPTRVNSVPASNFVSTMAANVDNPKMSDSDFRQFVMNTLPFVEYDSKCSCGQPGIRRWDNSLDSGYHCDECWEKLISEARVKSW